MKQKISNGFFLYHCNSLELLAKKAIGLSDKIFDVNPLKTGTVIVQTPGIGRWFSLKIAETNKICANIEMISPEKFLSRTAREIFNIDQSNSSYETENLKWVVFNLLSTDFINRKGLEIIKEYIKDNSVKKYQVSGKIADLLDQYFVYRPELIDSWRKNRLFYKNDKDEIWQKQIFDGITLNRPDDIDKEKFHRKFVDNCLKFNGNSEFMPKAALLFGISTMSIYQLEMFKALSELIEVHLFYLNPSVEFWGDIVSTKTEGIDEFFYESKNRLLSELGLAGKNFFNLVMEFGKDEDLFDLNPSEKTMLSTIQNDIRYCRESTFVPDNSIIFNGCWGKMREMEVLKDTLLDLFNKNKDLKPHEIIVMAPEIDEYSQFIEAVFGNEQGENFIPCTIADKSAKKDSRLIETFLKILKLEDTNYKKSALLSIFEIESVHKKFGVDKNDLGKIRTAVERSGIKWGIDKNWRKANGYPFYEQNSWKFGIDRMLLGYAMPGKGLNTFLDILPYDDIEGSEGRIIAKFFTFISSVFQFMSGLKTEKSLAGWSERLNTAISDFFEENSNTSNEIKYLRTALFKIKQSGDIAEFKGTVPLSVFYESLEEYVSNSGFGRGYITGQITFCSLKPMRSIPFKIICLIGMNDEVFPRDENRTAFDLIARYPKVSDRSVKLNDKYLFLETLISAKEKLIISYNARNLSNPSYNLQSIPAESLKNYIIQNRKIIDEKSFELETLHPLQPFSLKYFSDEEKYFTFSEKDASAAALFSSGDEIQVDKFKNGILDSGELEMSRKRKLFEPELLDFISFFNHPQKYFFRNRLDIIFPYMKEEEEDFEMFSIDNLSGYALKQEYLEIYGKGLQSKDFKIKMRGEGKIPHGITGRILLNNQISNASDLINKINFFKDSSSQESQMVDLIFNISGSRLRIKGNLDSIYSRGQLLFRPVKKASQKDLIKCLVMHLLLNASGIMKETVFFFMEENIIFHPVKNSFDELSELVEIYKKGVEFIPLFNPWIVEKMSSELKRGRSDEDAFSQMIENIDNDFDGLKSDAYFDIAAQLSGFFETDLRIISEVSELSRKISSKIDKFSERF